MQDERYGGRLGHDEAELLSAQPASAIVRSFFVPVCSLAALLYRLLDRLMIPLYPHLRHVNIRPLQP